VEQTWSFVVDSRIHINLFGPHPIVVFGTPEQHYIRCEVQIAPAVATVAHGPPCSS
jgi:hypothetical protein